MSASMTCALSRHRRRAAARQRRRNGIASLARRRRRRRHETGWALHHSRATTMAAPSACDITLRCLGFCGADDSVEPHLLRAVSAAYEWVEWGVLLRPDKSGSPRYASDKWLARLGDVNSARRMRLAAHMCSSRVDDLLQGKSDYVRKLHHEACRAHAREIAPCATAPCGPAPSRARADNC